MDDPEPLRRPGEGDVEVVLGIPLIVAAANLRTVAATPAPAPARPAGCAAGAPGAGGCGA